MRKLDQYLLKAFIGPFFAILMIVVFILLMQFLWLYIDELVGKGLSFKVVLEFLGWGGATMLPLSLPLATVLSSVMTMGNLAENSELTAMKAAGISLRRVLAPLMVAAGGIAVGAFFISNNLVPHAYNEIYTLREDILKTKEEIIIPSNTFYDGIEGYILRVEQNDRKTGMMHKVMVYNHSANNGNVSLTLADSAVMRMSAKKDYLTFNLYDGINYEETNSTGGRDTTLQVQRTEFTKQELVMPIEHYGFEKSRTGKYSDQAKSMSLKDLTQDQDSIGIRLDKQMKNQLDELRRDRTLFHNRQMDTSYNSSGKGVFPLDSLPVLDLDKDIDIHNAAMSRIDNYTSTIIGFGRDTGLTSFTLKLIDLEIYGKFSLALVCFLLFFVGAPIGALIRKGGLGVPAIISVLFFVLYYIINIIGTKLARDGSIDPFDGAFIASYIILPIGIVLTRRAIRDKSLIGSEVMIEKYKKIKHLLILKVKRPGIVYMGTPEFAVAPLQALMDKGYRIDAVVTVPDKPSGRGMLMNESAVKKFAVQKGLTVLQPENLRDEAFISKLKSFKSSLFVVVAFRLLPKEVWNIPSLGTFNLHAALLPQYRGAAPINWAIINGERNTGVTSFLIDDGVDTGTILMREDYRISEEDNASSVHDALMSLGAQVVCDTVESLITGDIQPRVQKSFIQGNEELHKAPKLSRELCHIDWNDSARNIVNLVRGLSDYPCAYTNLVGADGTATALKIFTAAKSERTMESVGAEGGFCGRIFSDGKTFIAVSCADGLVELRDIQLAGKKRMPVEDFLRGFHDIKSFTADPGSSKAAKGN